MTERQEALGIDWIGTHETLKEAIPPAYTEYLGRQLLAALTQTPLQMQQEGAY